MLTLNLITKEKSDISYELVTFSDSQPHIKIKEFKPEVMVDIITRLSTPSDILLLLFAREALLSMGVTFVNLEVSYLLTARMDRIMNPGEPFSLKVIAELLDKKFRDVSVFDAHSSVTDNLIGQSNNQIPFLSEIDLSYTVLISPDKGATEKTNLLGAYFHKEVIYCTKTRDTKTGYLSNVNVESDDLEGKKCLIVDDICDGGRTFINLYEALKQKNAGDISLAVSHGIFSQGLKPLSMFKRIYTTNSFKEIESQDNLTVIKLF